MKHHGRLSALITLVLLGFAILAFTSSCGFKLRGQIELSEAMQVIALEGTPGNGELAITIRNVIARAGGKLVPVDAANSILVILEDNSTRRVLSVDNLGQANAYTLIYRLGFRLDSTSAEPIIKAQTIEQQRQYRFNASNVLATGDEEQRIIRVMREDAINRMLVMLQAQLEGQTVVPAKENVTEAVGAKTTDAEPSDKEKSN